MQVEPTFHAAEFRGQMALSGRRAGGERGMETGGDRERVICAVIAALERFPEAREAVLAALRSGAEGGRDRVG